MKKIPLFLLLISILIVGIVSADYEPDKVSYLTVKMGGVSGAYTLASTNGSFYNLRNQVGDAVTVYTGGTVSIGLNSADTTDVYNDTRRYIFIGNLSLNSTTLALPNTTITAAEACFRAGSTSETTALGFLNFALVGGFPKGTGLYPSILATDYSKTDYVRYSDDKTPAQWTNSVFNCFALNAAGIANISKSGNTNFTLMLANDVDNSTTGIVWANQLTSRFPLTPNSSSTVAYRPYWNVTGLLSDISAPDAISNLAETHTCSSINWTWTNPTSSDFNHTYVKRWNTFYANYSNTTTYANWTGLAASTQYSFNSTTVDFDGNMNLTHWQNLTATTDICATPTPTPTPAPVLAGCSYFNVTAITFGINSTDWNATEGLTAWGITTTNVSQGNVSWWMCRATPTPTPTPLPWQPQINPSTDRKIEWTLEGIWYYLFGG